MKRVITSGRGYGYAPETHLYYVVVVLSKGVQMRLQLSDVCGEGRVVAGASGYELDKELPQCTADVDTCPDGTSEARLVSARSDDDRSLANQQHRLVAFPKDDHRTIQISDELH